MTESESKALQAKEKREMASPAEMTSPGPVFTPAVDIFETDRDLNVLADMPGVKSEDLTIDLRESVLTLSAEVSNPESEKETEIFREYRTGRYFRQFTLSEVIDQEKIEAKMQDGVLSLKLPKIAPATPRRIEVRTA